MDVMYHIMRYLNGASGKALIFIKRGHFNIEGYCDYDWASCTDDTKSTSGYCMLLGAIWSLGRVRKQ